jgi:hypothetical protein
MPCHPQLLQKISGGFYLAANGAILADAIMVMVFRNKVNGEK